MYVFTPVHLIAAPLALWFAACIAWSFLPGDASCARIRSRSSAVVAFGAPLRRRAGARAAAAGGQRLQGRFLCAPSAGSQEGLRELFAVRLLEAYTTSYLHFAPGLSDNAGFNLPEMPANAYLGLYIDSDGPIGVMRHLVDKETAYFRYPPDVSIPM